jgi:Ca2+-binding EF-hand superfamily protein
VYGDVKSIESSRSPRQKKDVHLRRLETSMLRKFEAEELAHKSTADFTRAQVQLVKDDAHKNAVHKTKQWRADVDSGLIEIPWDFIDTDSVNGPPSPTRPKGHAPSKLTPSGFKSPRNNSRQGPRSGHKAGGAWGDPSTKPRFPPMSIKGGNATANLNGPPERRVRQGGSAWMDAQPQSLSPSGNVTADLDDDDDDALQAPNTTQGYDGSLLSTAHLEIIFDEIDLNHNGTVSADELKDAIQTNPVVQEMLGFHDAMTPAEERVYTELYRQIDDNHDNMITIDEFEQFLFHARGVRHADHSHLAKDESELLDELADMQLQLLDKQHKLADIVHKSLDVLPADRIKVDAVQKLRDEEQKLLNAYAYRVKQLQTIQAAQNSPGLSSP